MAYYLILIAVSAIVVMLLLLGYFTSPGGLKAFAIFRNAIRRHVPMVVAGGLLLVLTFVGLMVFSSMQSIKDFRSNARLIDNSNKIISKINELRIDSASGASSQRGALISDTPLYKESFENYRKKYPGDAAALAALVAGNQAQSARVREITKLLDLRFSGWEQTLQASSISGFDLSTVAGEINDNLQSSVALRDLFAAMEQDQQAQLAESRAQFQASSRKTVGILISATVLSTLLAAMIFIIVLFERRNIIRARQRGLKLQSDQANLMKQMKQQTKNIAAQRVRDRAMLKSLGEGFIATDEYGHIISVNPAAEEMLGYSHRELTGKWYISTIKAYDNQGRPIEPMERPMGLAISSGRAVATVTNFERKDGTKFPVFVTVSPLLLRGKPIGAVEVFRNIARERELDQAKDEFVSLASHQLRTPAAGVKAFASMLLDGYGGSVTPQQRSFLQQIYDSNERQLRIVEDLLNVARFDSGRMSLNRSPANINDLINSVVAELTPQINEKNQNLSVQVASDLPPVQVDAEKIRMALDNLIGNASKYTPPGGNVTVRASAQRSRLIIRIEDNGIGIDKADIPSLFRKFGRIETTHTAALGGTGLGLYLAQQIARMHGGDISVKSRPREGSSFTLKLPITAQLLYRQTKGAKRHESPPIG